MRDPGRAVTYADAHRLLGDLARTTRTPLLVVAAATLVSSGAALALPAVLGTAADAVLAGRGTAVAVAWLAGLILLAAAAEVVGGVAGAVAMTSGTAGLRTRFIDHVLDLDVVRARRFPAGDLASRLGGNAMTAGHVPLTLLRAVAGLLTSIGGVIALFGIDTRVGLAFLAGVPLLLVAVRVFVDRASQLYGGYQDAQGRLAGRLLDTLAGVRTVRASGTTEREIGRVLAPLTELSAAGRALWRAQASSVWQVSLLLVLIELLVLGVTGLGIAEGVLAPGSLLAVAGYTALAMTVMDQFDTLLDLIDSRAAAIRLCEVLALPGQRRGDRPLLPGPGSLSFNVVTVAAASMPVLRRLDLHVPAGLLTAVVGSSGSGKSTLALLAGGLIDPTEGEVLLDGRPIRDIDPVVLRAEVAYAFERPALLGPDLGSAIAYGLAADREHVAATVTAAARAARIDDVVRRLPLGYATPVDAVPLSGGEFQRLGLARALARRARLTVLDDATSSLDTATEAEVIRTLTEGMRGRTRLVVAHRTTTAAHADLVVWMDNGRVRARGTHAELWHDPAYRAMFNATGDDRDEGDGR
ncbi:ABC transporter ATP-binding protein [Nonomuraea sp. NPDC050790]|uniref:ABC transporter ATP-binding protein n=1 Tax=Nonomuraea sp. NPDC050790 TaxID=3364371 RepID=UPI00379182A4